MDSRSRAAFLALIIAQAAHSIEEYAFRLFDVLAPARFISGLLSDDLARGFAIANVGWCSSAPGVMWHACIVGFRRLGAWPGSGRCSSWEMGSLMLPSHSPAEITFQGLPLRRSCSGSPSI